MAFDPASFNPPGLAADFSNLQLPIFHIEPVQLQFPIAADLAAVQVANNVIILALVSGLILRIDLANPQEVDDIVLTEKGHHQIGTIRKIFLDPTASHLIITTTSGDNFYLHSRSTKPRPLPRFKNCYIECVAWSPALPTTTTREILIGDREGNIFETYVEGTDDSGFMRREERSFKHVYQTTDGEPVTGLWVDTLPGKSDLRRVIVTTPGALMHWVGRVQRHGGDYGSIFHKFFENEAPSIQDFRNGTPQNSMLAISPDSTDDQEPARIFAWLNAPGVYHGKLLVKPPTAELGAHVFSTSKLFSKTGIPTIKSPITAVALTQYHIIVLSGTDVYAINRLDDSVVFQEAVVDPGATVLGLCSDSKKQTLWAYTSTELFEVVITDEDRHVWKIMLADKSFDNAMRFAKTPMQKDQVLIAHGDHLIANGKYLEAAQVYGGSTKSFEEVTLTFLENSETDALRKYLLVKMSHLKKTSIMQRIMVASWLIELFMSRLNSLEDTLSTISANASASATSSDTIRQQLNALNNEYQDFVLKYKNDLDRKTTYEIISSHGRERELLFYANIVNDYTYVLAYWIQREKWAEALDVLKKQTDPEIFYKYSSVLMAHAPVQTVDILLRQTNLEPRALIPALLNYNKFATVPINQNQAVRYLLYVINQHGSTDAAVHNTLISIYASNPAKDESSLLQYLESSTGERHYDLDFALRLCIQHGHVQSCVHIYSSMGQYAEAVELALKHGNVELASIVADRPDDDPAFRKKLWLQVAKAVIQQSPDIKSAIDFIAPCTLLKIEDLIPLFPDFTTIDSFQQSICASLESYSHSIDRLKTSMNDSSHTAARIAAEISALDRRYAIVEPGERCFLCQYPLLSRGFFVFPCQHAFHADCITSEMAKGGGIGIKRRVEELREKVRREQGKERERWARDLEDVVASECVLCSEFAIRRVDEPFLGVGDEGEEWAL